MGGNTYEHYFIIPGAKTALNLRRMRCIEDEKNFARYVLYFSYELAAALTFLKL